MPPLMAASVPRTAPTTNADARRPSSGHRPGRRAAPGPASTSPDGRRDPVRLARLPGPAPPSCPISLHPPEREMCLEVSQPIGRPGLVEPLTHLQAGELLPDAEAAKEVGEVLDRA